MYKKTTVQTKIENNKLLKAIFFNSGSKSFGLTMLATFFRCMVCIIATIPTGIIKVKKDEVE